jgi:hypothetical protein
MQDGCLIDANYWRRMPNGQPALLKSRRPVRLEDAIHFWKQLLF